MKAYRQHYKLILIKYSLHKNSTQLYGTFHVTWHCSNISHTQTHLSLTRSLCGRYDYILILRYRWGNWETHRLSNFPEVSEAVNRKQAMGLNSGSLDSMPLTMMVCCLSGRQRSASLKESRLTEVRCFAKRSIEESGDSHCVYRMGLLHKRTLATDER